MNVLRRWNKLKIDNENYADSRMFYFELSENDNELAVVD